jgi:tetratricopeptide (TPR) repeat protein
MLATAQSKLNAGKLDEALDWAGKILDLQPTNVGILTVAAKIAFQLGRFEAAADFAGRAYEYAPSVESGLVAAETYKRIRRYDDARDLYVKALQAAPQHEQGLAGLADLYERAGYRSLAIETYERCLGVKFAIENYHQYSKLLPYRQSPRLYQTLLKAGPQTQVSSGRRILYAVELAIQKERNERFARGLPQTATSLDELFFKFAVAERDAAEQCVDQILAQEPTLEVAQFIKASSLVMRGRAREAEAYFRSIEANNPTHLAANVVYDEPFYKRLEAASDDELFGALPAVTDVVAMPAGDGPIYFVSCDYNYFLNFARPMLSSINTVSPQSNVHVHIIATGENDLGAVTAFCASLKQLRTAISVEIAPETTREYYHAIRFVRLYQYLQRYRQAMCILDVDALLHQDLRPILSSLGEVDVGLTAHTGIWAPWNQFRAGVVALMPTLGGVGYARLVAAYIAAFLRQKKVRWGVDQVALYAVYLFLADQRRAPRIKLLDGLMLDSECVDGGVIWCNSGTSKFERPIKLRNEPTSPDSPQVKYCDALDRLGYAFA